MPPLVNLAGRRFGRLTVTTRATNVLTSAGNPRTRWNAVCDCGADVIVRQGQLTSGRTKSCGCWKIETARLNGLTRKEVPGYAGIHTRLRTERGKAREHRCADCGRQAADWSYVVCAEELIGRKGRGAHPYCLHLEHYVPRCKACHIATDRERGPDGRLLPARERTPA